MTDDRISQPVTRTISGWSGGLTVDYRDVFKALTDGLTTITKIEWDRRARQAVDSIRMKTITHDPFELLYCLIFRAVTRTLFEVAQSTLHRLTRPDDDRRAGLLEEFDFSFESEDLAVSPAMLEHTESMTILETIKRPFRKWLYNLGLKDVMADSIMERFDPYFACALDEEWYYRMGEYQLIRQAFPMPFTQGETMERAWLAYNHLLRKKLYEPYMVFASFDVHQLYVPLRAWHDKKREPDPEFDHPLSDFIDRRDKTRIIVDLEERLTAWVEKKDARDSLRMINAIRGGGLRYFVHTFAARAGQSGLCRPLIVPLYEADVNGDLEDRLERYFIQQTYFMKNPLKTEDDQWPILLIFHRLNDLPCSDPGIFENGFRLMTKIISLLDRYNKQSVRLLAMVTGWEPLISAMEIGLPNQTEILHALPLPSFPDDPDTFEDPRGLGEEDQRDLWWRLYGRATGREYRGLPDHLREKGGLMDYITFTPIRNYLLAHSITRGRLKNPEEADPIQLVDDMTEDIHEHIFAEDRPYRWAYYIDYPNYIRALKEVGITARHHGWQRAPLSKVKERFQKNGLASYFESFVELVRTGILGQLKVLPSRPRALPQEQEEVLQFFDLVTMTHFSVRRITAELLAIKEELDRKNEFPYYGIEERLALLRWIFLCGPIEASPGLRYILNKHISFLGGNKALELQKMICRLISYIMEFGLPMESLPGSLPYKEQERSARNAEEALLTAHYACAEVTGQRGIIEWQGQTDAGAWIRKLQGQRTGHVNRLVLQCLAYLNLTGSILDGIDLRGANLFKTDLRGASIRFAILAQANMQSVNLNEADLRHSSLIEADLKQAYLREADMRWADLRWADLREADLGRANLGRSHMNKAILVRADLREADMRGAHLHNADLESADLRGANLGRARLTGANLKGADLTQANLKGAYLSDADLSWAGLSGANLKGAELSGIKGLKETRK